MKPTLVLGLGNPLQGDDGVGIRAVEVLWKHELPPGVEIMDAGTPGVGLINLMEGRRRVVIVDAVEMGRKPGTVVRLTLGPGLTAQATGADEHPQNATLVVASEAFSLHGSGVAEALALADALDLVLPEVVVFGIQPFRVGWGDALSPELEAALPGLVDAVLQEIQESSYGK